MAWDFSTDPEFQETLDWIREFVDEEILPIEAISDELDQDQLDQLTAPLKAEVRRRNLWAAHLDPELGGQGMGQLKLGLMHEILGRTQEAPGVFGNQAPDSGNAELLAVGANEEQKEKWLWPLLDGQLRSCFSMTEAHVAGSDPTQIRTLAVRDGDEWVINGHKWFASNADIADFTILMAVTNPDAQPHRRAGMFVIPAGTPGMNIVRKPGTMSHPDSSPRKGRGGNHCEVIYEDARVPAENLIGQPGEGFVLAQKRLGGGRIHHAMRMLGVCQRAFDGMRERVVSRTSHGKVLSQHQLMQDMIAETAVDIETARLLTLKAAWTMDHTGASNSRAEIAMIKYYGAKVAMNVLDRAIQIHGSLGYTTDLPYEGMYRAARALRIADGADEVHKVSIARHFLRDAEPVEGWPSEHLPTRREAAVRKFQHLVELHTENL
ncbi:acyl-CoA dehydrogenase family protein [Myxococcota bacterium]|nr:acyl-CoA dehydrogenase family protein [Myxococcota bacterium]